MYVSLENFSQEELKTKSKLELTRIILEDAEKALGFHELFEKIAEIKDFTEKEKEEIIAQYYTELNVNGRFITLGANVWGLKKWYPVDQIDEPVTSAPKKRKGKSEDIDDDFDYEEDIEVAELGEEELVEEEDLDDEENYDDLADDLDDDVLDVDIDLDEEDENI